MFFGKLPTIPNRNQRLQVKNHYRFVRRKVLKSSGVPQYSLRFKLSCGPVMPEARDRLSRDLEVVSLLAPRPAVSGTSQDQAASPRFRFEPHHERFVRRALGGGEGQGALAVGGLETPRTAFVQDFNLFGLHIGQLENTSIGDLRRRYRTRRSRTPARALPSWYPRAPLRDITAIIRAIERRRQLAEGNEGQEIGSPLPESVIFQEGYQSPSLHLQNPNNFVTPIATLPFKRLSPSIKKFHKILHDITNQPSENEEPLTPQRKLLNSIDTVEKAVMDEIKKLKRTPVAKRAEREKKLKTLMSMSSCDDFELAPTNSQGRRAFSMIVEGLGFSGALHSKHRQHNTVKMIYNYCYCYYEVAFTVPILNRPGR